MREEVADFFRIHCQQITGQRANVTSQKKLAALQHVQKKKKNPASGGSCQQTSRSGCYQVRHEPGGKPARLPRVFLPIWARKPLRVVAPSAISVKFSFSVFSKAGARNTSQPVGLDTAGTWTPKIGLVGWKRSHSDSFQKNSIAEFLKRCWVLWEVWRYDQLYFKLSTMF